MDEKGMFERLSNDEFHRFAAQIAAQLLAGAALGGETEAQQEGRERLAAERWSRMIGLVEKQMFELNLRFRDE